MSDETIFGIDGEKSLSILEDLHKILEKHGTKAATAVMVGYAALLVPENICFGGWRPDAIDVAAKAFREIAHDRLIEIKAAHGHIEEMKETHGYIH